jgi:hypothetical protein
MFELDCNPYLKYSPKNFGAIGGIQPDFAENNICNSLIQQPANSISSFAYNIFGYMLIKEEGDTKVKWIMILLLQAVGLGSFVLHSTASYYGQLLDFIPMFGIVSYFLYLTLSGRSRLLAVIFAILGVIILLTFPQYRIILLAMELTLLLTLEIIQIQKYKYTFAYLWSMGWLVFLLSFGFWLMDEFRLWDIDYIEHYFNAHVIWHIGTAMSLWLVAKYYLQKSRFSY